MATAERTGYTPGGLGKAAAAANAPPSSAASDGTGPGARRLRLAPLAPAAGVWRPPPSGRGTQPPQEPAEEEPFTVERIGLNLYACRVPRRPRARRRADAHAVGASHRTLSQHFGGD